MKFSTRIEYNISSILQKKLVVVEKLRSCYNKEECKILENNADKL